MIRSLRLVGLFMFLGFSLSALAEPPDLGLRLECNMRSARVGDEVRLKLEIAGPGVTAVFAGTEGLEFGPGKSAGFVCEFAVRPREEGTITLGPYSLSFGGQQLTSNTITMKVFPEWDGRYGTFLRVDRDAITLGECFELIMETWSTERGLKPVTLKRDQSFTSIMGPAQSKTEIKNEKKVHYNRWLWRITPKQTGEFSIAENLFAEIPEGIQPPHLSVTVADKE